MSKDKSQQYQLQSIPYDAKAIWLSFTFSGGGAASELCVPVKIFRCGWIAGVQFLTDRIIKSGGGNGGQLKSIAPLPEAYRPQSEVSCCVRSLVGGTLQQLPVMLEINRNGFIVFSFTFQEDPNANGVYLPPIDDDKPFYVSYPSVVDYE